VDSRSWGFGNNEYHHDKIWGLETTDVFSLQDNSLMAEGISMILMDKV